MYNYAVQMFNQGMHICSTNKDYKDALNKLRSAKWAIKQVMKFMEQLSGNMKAPPEFTPESLNFLRYLFEALTYNCMLRILEQNPASTPESQASLDKEIATLFLRSKQVMENSKLVRKLFDAFLSDVSYNHYRFAYESIDRARLKLVKMHEQEITKGYAGIALGYMEQAQNLIQVMDHDKSVKKEDKKSFTDRFNKEMLPMYKDVKEKNDKIYKSVVPHGKDLTWVAKWDKEIPDSVPDNMYVPPANSHCFQHFLSDELETVKSNLQLFVTNKKQSIQKMFYDMKDKKDQVYKEQKVEFIINSQAQSNSQMDPKFYEDLKILNEQNGGIEGYEMLYLF